MKKIILVLGTCLLTTTTFAAGGTKSYDMYAPKAGGHEFKGGVTIWSAKTSPAGGGTDTTGSGFALGLNYAYGIMENIAFNVNQDYYAYKTDNGTSFDIKGLGATSLGVKGLVDFSGPFFYYEAGYSTSMLAKRKSTATETNSADSEDQRDHLFATVGGGTEINGFGFGAKLTQLMFQNTDEDSSGTTVTFKSGSGNKWNVYAQYDFGAKVGLSYGERTIDSYDVGTSGTVAKSEIKQIKVYGIIPVNSELDVLADVTKMNLKDESAYSKYDNYLVSLSAKYTF